ncbi:hypothetical protein [Bacillus marasmi]|uniref:hypothetical protein n=1 Tax=Bacillus marasmi TaxID=1926279 RepID=UPI0011CCB07C|nr:hypothetical protein [Bacillus marasmi]
MTFILPILIILFLVGVPMAIMKLFSRNSFFKQWFRIMLAGYLAILLVGTVLVFTLPMESNISGKIVQSERPEMEYVDLYEVALQGKLDDEKYALKQKEWSFDFKGDALELKAEVEGQFFTSIVVEKTDAADGKINAIFYKGKTYMNNWDVTAATKPARLILDGNTLMLGNPEHVQLEFSDFRNAFPVAQFTKERSIMQGGNFFSNQDLLYLKIPKSTKITNLTQLYIQYK